MQRLFQAVKFSPEKNLTYTFCLSHHMARVVTGASKVEVSVSKLPTSSSTTHLPSVLFPFPSYSFPPPLFLHISSFHLSSLTSFSLSTHLSLTLSHSIRQFGRCIRCHSVWYCNEECQVIVMGWNYTLYGYAPPSLQKSDWVMHKIECKSMVGPSPPSDRVRMIMRAMHNEVCN